MTENTPPTPPPIQTPPGSGTTVAKWPKVLGIILLIFGVLGLGQGIIAPFSFYLTKNQMQQFVKMGADQDRVDDYLSQLKSLSLMSGVAYALISILLISGAILMLKRRRICSPLLQTWAVLKILVGGYTVFRQIGLSTLQMSIMMLNDKKMGGKEAEMMESIVGYSMKIGMVIGMIWLCALPIFVIVWMNRAKVRDQMETW